MMDSSDDITGPVNLGNPAEYSMEELAGLVVAQTNSRSELAYAPLPQDDPRQRQPDITRAREQLGWQPTVPLEEGLKRTIDYFRSVVS